MDMYPDLPIYLAELDIEHYLALATGTSTVFIELPKASIGSTRHDKSKSVGPNRKEQHKLF
jgi:hypothetical protein